MPIVTLSRMYGSGGSQIAERVAYTLGWTLLDNAVVDQVAERLGVSAAEVSAREERVPSLAERLATTLTLGSPELRTPVDNAAVLPVEERMLDVTRRVIAEAAARGPVVVVGRGAQMMLAERDDALHVFCAAPREALIARARERISPGERRSPERIVDETNRQREQYVMRHWQRSWTAPENYHLCVNTAWLGIDGAVELVVHVARRKFAADMPGLGAAEPEGNSKSN
jgi:cytidylate kinase